MMVGAEILLFCLFSVSLKMILQALVFDPCAEVATFNYNKLACMKKGKSVA